MLRRLASRAVINCFHLAKFHARESKSNCFVDQTPKHAALTSTTTP